MSTKPSIHLTPDERKTFEALPAAVREGWVIVTEELTSYETERQLKIRRDIFRQKDPRFQALLVEAQKIGKGGSLEKIAETARPLLNNLLYTMGAVYLRGCIAAMLPAIQSENDVQGLAAISLYRHLILETNANASSRHVAHV